MDGGVGVGLVRWKCLRSSLPSSESNSLDTNLYLHRKNPNEMLLIEVDASDVGWGACAYQMYIIWTGDPADEA
jgi:hypothetical protein